MATNKKKKDDRVRNWVIVFYPESAPVDYERIIRDWHVPAFLSPLHEFDVNADGEKKKPHYHLLLMFSGKKSIEQVQELSDQLSGVPVIYSECAVRDCKAVARYLIHLDNPEKYQYDRCTVISFAGVDYLQYIETSSDVFQMLADISEFILLNGICDLGLLQAYTLSYRRDWFRVVATHTVYISFLLKSVTWAGKLPSEQKRVYFKTLGKVFDFEKMEFLEEKN